METMRCKRFGSGGRQGGPVRREAPWWRSCKASLGAVGLLKLADLRLKRNMIVVKESQLINSLDEPIERPLQPCSCFLHRGQAQGTETELCTHTHTHTHAHMHAHGKKSIVGS